MIRINLIGQGKKKRSGTSSSGQQSLLIGVGIYVAAAAALFMLVDKPLQEEITSLESTVNRLNRDNKDKEKQLKNSKNIEKLVKEGNERNKVVLRLNDARATPAHLLRELANVMTPGGTATMTAEMVATTNASPSRKISDEWDPGHVWITSFTEKNGEFTLKGGAQSDTDMTQLALRLQASVFFHDVIPRTGNEAIDKTTGITYYKFTIAGKVAY